MAGELLRTPLYDAHVAFGARMVDFAGWSMPVVYTGIIEEHLHTRSACSVFDVSHMGRLVLRGTGVEAFLDRLCTRNLKGAEVGRSYYSHVCREDGGILDDVIVSRFEDHWLVVCNASNRAKIVAWINRHAAGTGVAMDDRTLHTAMLAVQGPQAMELARQLVPADLATLKRYRFTSVEYLGMRFDVFRSGYTGEDGIEVVCTATAVKMFLPLLVGSKDKPHAVIRFAGLGARDTLRIEAAMPLYGHELSEDWDSLTAGQAWCVDLSKDFIGADAMRAKKEKGLARQMIGLELEGKRIARQHAKVFSGASEAGEVTSGTLSPTLGKSVAMALVDSAAVARQDAKLEVEIGGGRVAVRVVPLPFYKKK